MDVPTRELKDRLSEYLKRAQGGEALTITAHGRPVARLLPPDAQDEKRAKTSPLAHLAWIRPGDGKKLHLVPLDGRSKSAKKIQLSDLVLQDRE